MNVLIVSEKPSLTRALAPIARQHWPAGNITFVHAVAYANIKFVYPRGLRMQDYPRVSEPIQGLASWASWACRPLSLGTGTLLTEAQMGPEHFTEADLIVYAGDPDHSGAVAFDVLMAVVFGDGRASECPALQLCSFDEASIREAFANIQPFGVVFGPYLEYGLIKRYFDWNWNVNALAILGDAARRAGVSPGAPPLSKYALQLLYAMRNQGTQGCGALVRLMRNWPGTGRYKYADSEWSPRLGSMASSAQILENLVTAGLLDQAGTPGRSELALSARGRGLLELLHPDCEDPDLPFRLDTWCQQGPAAKPAIDRYIRTFFGKQLRFTS